ncbi:HlyD family type I secretion periplasmic adaptor subunit [Rhizobium sp. TRM95796]|uniref:HlyD family type I secretion periplasmic adaptor subunit n=1 Tax=Rhizobium sp. TRM95796 TaxID=2979862 RepID=UPI0021E93B87|nr:HlyD family type I secretion periplasmic adaptor subunit [Rhizobium sp. TRM95796]MCV3766586.1 HlyD family type I secretion periplasmic adaptor subunit [Rhizobium sp. TRM95796]
MSPDALQLRAAPSAPQAAVQSWSARRYMIMGFATLFILVFGFGAWSVFTTMAGAVVGQGVVEVETKRQVIQHATGGVIGKILVRDGQVVEAGQTLIVFDDTFDRAELAVTESQLYPLLGVRARLIAEQDELPEPVFDKDLVERAKTDETAAEIIRSQRELLVARRLTRDKQIQQLQERKSQIEKQNDGLRARIAALQEQFTLLTGDVDRQKALLAKGLTEMTRVSAYERDAAQARGSMSESQASIAENRARVAELELAIINVSAQMREEAIKELSDTDAKVAELKERRNSTLETLSRIEVKAPMEGKVFNLQVHAIRAVVRAAEPIMEIVPEKVKLVVSVQLPPTQIDQVHEGQEAIIRFQSFDHRHTPDLNGRVRRVSADIITNERTGQSYYTASLELLPGEEKYLGPTQQIRPGMPVDVFIRTTYRTPWDYLVRPLTSYFGKSMLER